MRIGPPETRRLATELVDGVMCDGFDGYLQTLAERSTDEPWPGFERISSVLE